MVKWAKILAATVAGLIVLVVAVVLLVVWRVDPNRYKGYIAEQFQARTGRSLSIDRNLKFELYPWLAVEAGGVSIGNAAGFGARPFATIDHVSARVKLLPLLQRKFEVGTIILDGLSVSLERNRDGRGNWDDLLGHAGTEASATPGNASQPPFAHLGIQGIRIRNASIDWREDGALRYALSHVDVDTGPMRPNAPVDLTASFSLRAGTQLRAELTLKTRAGIAGGKLDLTGGSLGGQVSTPRAGKQPVKVAASWKTLSFDGADGSAAVAGLTTRTGDVEAAWQLTGNGLYATPRLKGRVAIRDAPLAPVLDWLDISVPKQIQRGALGNFDASTRFDVDSGADRFSFDSISIALLDSRMSGRASIDGKRLHAQIALPRFEPNGTLRRIIAAHLPKGLDAGALGPLAFDGTVNADLASGSADFDPLSIEIFGLRAGGKLRLRNVSRSTALSGEARIAAFDPRELLHRLGWTVPQTSDAKALRSASLETHFEIDKSQGRLQQLVLRLDDSRISGDLGVENFTHPAYRFALHVDRINVDRYLPPRQATARKGERKVGDMRVSADLLSRFKLAGRIDAGELTAGGLDMRHFATDIDLGGGVAKITSAKAQLYGGEFTGSLSVDAKSDEPKTQLTGKATKLDLKPLITALAGKAAFTGNGDFDVDLSTHGKTVTENVRSAAGHVNFTLRNGTIDGFNVGRSLCEAYNLTQKLPRPPNEPLQTRYQLIRGTAEVSHGVASSSKLLARSPFIEVTGGGRADLTKRSLSYVFEAKLTGSIPVPGCKSMDSLIGDSLPLTLRGSLEAPEIRPDYSKILRRRAQQELKKRAAESLLRHLL